MIFGHGGNIHELARRLACRPDDILDMSSNVNPLGPVPGLMDYLKERLDAATRLPEVNAGAMVEAFAKRHDLHPDRILAGNGTTQWIYSLPLALSAKKALILGPTYSDYADACRMHKVAMSHLTSRAEDNFTPDLEKLDQLAKASDLVFICNPNNPTASFLRAGDLIALCRRRTDTVFVIDESYLPFVMDGARHSLMNESLPNCVVLNSMSKIFRLPGLRIGFVTASAAIMAKLKGFHLPWSVNSLALEVVCWLMRENDTVDRFIATSQAFLQEQRELFQAQLRSVPGLTCFPSTTSYILIRLPVGLTATKVCQALAEEKILIRNCSNFKGLSEQYIRVSLKGRPCNKKVAEKLVLMGKRWAG